MKSQNVFRSITLAFVLLIAFKGFSQSKRELTLSYEKHTNISEEKKLELLTFFAGRDADDYYVAPLIPEQEMEEIEQALLPSESEVLVLIDAQLFGPAKDCLIIGMSGIYFKNGWASDQSGRHFISFDEFKTAEISIKRDEVGIGSLSFNPTGSYTDMEFIITLLKDLQKKL